MFSAVFEPSVNIPYLKMSGVRKAHNDKTTQLATTAGRLLGGGGSFGFAQFDEKVPLSLTFLSHFHCSVCARIILLSTGEDAFPSHDPS